MTKLRPLGLVRRVSRRNSHQSAVYIRDDEAIVAEVLTRPTRTAEVVHAVLATGWQTAMIPEHFRAHVLSRLK